MKFRKRKGFTLIEAIISIMLLGIISISILTMSTYGVKYAKWNNIRLTALNLAYSQVEWLKILDYKDLGLNITGYSPKGEVEPNQYMNNTELVEIENVIYNIYTNITWEKAISNTGEPVPEAIKKIDVTIEAKDLNSGEMKEYAVLGTLVSQEGERKFSEPGHIVATVYLRSFNNPIKNVRVGLGQGLNYSYYTNTDQDGKALLGNIKSGEYKIEPLSFNYKSLMVMPNGVEIKNGKQSWKLSKSVTVPKWDKTKGDQIKYPEEDFLIDLPGNINIIDKDKYKNNNIKINIKPKAESYTPIEGEKPDHMSLNTKINEINDIPFWRSWNYEYDISLGEEKFLLIDNDTMNLWDGKFDNTELNKESNVDLSLAFGFKEIKLKIDQGELNEIIMKFSSDVKNSDDMGFKLDDVSIDKEGYSIVEIQDKNMYKIEFKTPVIINNESVEFRIINGDEILNKYNMPLFQDESFIFLDPKD